MITERRTIPGGSVGSSFELVVQRFGQVGARPCVYIQASLHADEIPGMACAVVLRNLLQAQEAAGHVPGEIVLVPVANPIGLGQRVLGHDVGRFNLADGVNFNRDYPALGPQLADRVRDRLTDDAAANVAMAREALDAIIRDLPALTPAEHLRKALLGAASGADLVLDLHCDSEAAVHLYTHDRSAETFAPLAARLGARALLVAAISGGDPFDEALSRPWVDLAEAAPDRPVPFACQSATVELRGQGDVTSELAAADAAAILAYLQDVGAVAGTPPAAPPPLCTATALAASEPIVAERGGVLFYRVAPGDHVRAGDVIAEIIDPVTGEMTAVPAPCDGVLFARSGARYAVPGRRLGKVAGREAHRTGRLLSP